MTIDDLMQQIEETERLIGVYRNADKVGAVRGVVGIEGGVVSGC
jgi:hypothetical protein